MEKHEELTIEILNDIWRDGKDIYERFLRWYPELRDFFFFREAPGIGSYAELTKYAQSLHSTDHDYEADGPDMQIIYDIIMNYKSRQRIRLWQRWFKK